MTLSPLVRLLVSFPAFAKFSSRTGRRRARAVVFLGLLMFGLCTLGLILATETVKPEWRDPEYGCRQRAVRRWQQDRPDRPLVLLLGSSRAQMGVSPAAMEFPDEPGSPLVYNFGYCSGFPLLVWLQFLRLLDDGVKPRAVVVMVSAFENKTDAPADAYYQVARSRFSSGDLRRLAPHTEQLSVHQSELQNLRVRSWGLRRELLLSDLFPNWQSNHTRFLHTAWESMDPYGWTPFPTQLQSKEFSQGAWNQVRAEHPPTMNNPQFGAVSERVYRNLVARCRAEQIAVAFVWAPESPAYRTFYTPAGRAQVQAEHRMFTTELGIPMFPAPDHFAESEFVDGYHLLPPGAAKYSRWLADAYLKPWLASIRREHP